MQQMRSLQVVHMQDEEYLLHYIQYKKVAGRLLGNGMHSPKHMENLLSNEPPSYSREIKIIQSQDL